MRITVALCLAIVFGSAACKSPPPSRAQPIPVADAAIDAPVVLRPVDVEARIAERIAALSPDAVAEAKVHAADIAALAVCKPASWGGFDRYCPEHEPVWDRRIQRGSTQEWLAIETLAWWLSVETANEMVRRYLVERSTREDGDPDLLAVMLAKETDPVALHRHLQDIVNGHAPTSAALLEMVQVHARHPDASVRLFAQMVLAKQSPD